MKWEDSWAERLRFLGQGRVVFMEWPNGRTLKIEAYTEESIAKKLVAEFGGKAGPAHDWLSNPAPALKPASVRGRLRIYSDPGTFSSRPPTNSKYPRDLLIPAGMAFGTGDHATTMTCLRMLCDKSKGWPPGWSALDAGCGTGILGIAASVLGATKVDAFDFDPLAVRAAKENVKLNPGCKMSVKPVDIHEWTPPRQYDVVLANLFSDLLIGSASKLAAAAADGGTVILSGILRTQFPEVKFAMHTAGLSFDQITFVGKWTAAICVKRSAKS